MDLREKIIDAATELFGEKGYDKTTVSEIINKAGSSKGGFYHHFKSKEDILDAITNNFMEDLLKHYEQVLIESDESVIYAFNDVFNRFVQFKEDQVKDWPKMKKIYTFTDIHIYIRKMADQFEALTSELYTKLIIKGVEEGLFTVKYPDMLAGMWTREILRVYIKAKELVFVPDSNSETKFEELLDFAEEFINNALGVPNKTIHLRESALEYVKNTKEKAKELQL